MIDIEVSTEYSGWAAARRAELLNACAEALEAARPELVELARAETRLGTERLEAELTRTTGQLRLLGEHVFAGGHLRPLSSPGAAPGGGDIVTVELAVGPVAVFGASNFPFAFGVAGGDTASALAAGCPVVVKGHPAQPGLSRRIAALLAEAIEGAGAPKGTFTFVEGGPDVSIELVTHPSIKAVAFTGSPGGGRALMDAAAARPEPIPVYAEMGSVNPVFVLPGAARDLDWAQTLAGAVVGSAGQLCTKPGVIIAPDSAEGETLAQDVVARINAAADQQMLTAPMATEHRRWQTQVEGSATEGMAAGGTAAEGADYTVRPFAVIAPELEGEFAEEHFGPTTVLHLADPATYTELASRLGGQLTATIIATPEDTDQVARLLPALAGIAGRIIYNGVPTGVAVTQAMIHGGPWPATSAPWSTSVGTESVRRFLRPVALQNLPADLLSALRPS
ncbi:aldehyde dehydrogenase family protein [Spirillospora sp. CA-294931]|uniref:aldehyde dehydrogenase family protein n=1 Tax=Spirillospora sp. CA-294931 TaxID=3240042 RepID=UPI003D89C5FB